MKLAIEGVEPRIKELPVDKHEANEDMREEVLAVLKSGDYTIFDNSKLAGFEEQFAAYLNVRHAVATTNCTSALQASLMAIGEGEFRGKNEVIMPAFTYAATLMAVINAGCKPVIVDVDRDTFTINCGAAQSVITENTKAIIPVHAFGNAADINKLVKFNLPLIEDTAHATGAKLNKRFLGTFGIGCHSFGDCKILRTGEGGAVTTNDDKVAEQVRIIRHEGEIWNSNKKSTVNLPDFPMVSDFLSMDYQILGHNFRPHPLVLALGCAKLRQLDGFIKRLNENANYLKRKLVGEPELIFQKTQENCERVYQSLVCTIAPNKMFDRDKLLYCLAAEGVPVGVQFPVNLADTLVAKRHAKIYDCPNTEFICKNHLMLPNYASLTKEHLNEIADAIKKVLVVLRERGGIVKIKDRQVKKIYSALLFSCE